MQNEPSRHIIKRQVVELRGLREEDAQQAQQQVAAWVHERLVPLLDQYLTALSPNGSVLRLDTLELDLGIIPFDELESELLRGLDIQLGSQLAQLAPRPDQTAELPAAAAAPATRRELLHFFVRTGNLPWWAGSAAPGPGAASADPVTESVEYLLKEAPLALTADLREWVAQEGQLLRLIRHLPGVTLLRIAALRVQLPSAAFAGAVPEFFQLLPRMATFTGLSPHRVRETALLKLMQIVFSASNPIRDADSFWEAWLLQMAVALRVKYKPLLQTLNEAAGSDKSGFAAMLQRFQGAKTNPKTPPVSVLERLVHTLEQTLLPAPGRPTALTDAFRHWQSNTSSAGALEQLLKALEQLTGTSPATAKALETAFRQWQSDKSSAAALEQVLKALEQLTGTDPATANALETAFRHGQSNQSPTGALEQVLKALEQVTGASLAPANVLKTALRQWKSNKSSAMALTQLEDALRQTLAKKETGGPELIQKWVAALERLLNDTGLPEGLRATLAAAKNRLQAPGFSLAELPALLAQIARAEAARAPETTSAGSASTTFSEAGELFVENAGLVILWPFLVRFFQSLGLLEKNRFKDAAAAHRAARLLQYVADGQPDAPEYLMALNKIICGLEWDTLLDPGPPLSKTETEECEALLQAVIANAPVLRNMRPDGLRGSFLLRKGLLRPVPGAWELHVEKATHDVVLERFPWSWSVVKLPWLEGVLAVEW